MTETQTLDKDAFMRLVTQEHLQVEGPTAGYLYTGKQGRDGWELYRTPNNPWYLWSYKQVCTQDNVGGGTLRVDVTAASGQVMRVITGGMAASGNRAVAASIRDSSGAIIVYIDAVGAVAAAQATWPKAATASGTSQGAINSLGLLVPNPAVFSAQVTTAAQTETATLNVIFLLSNDTTPTISWANSGGTPNVAAATINTKTLVAVVP